ncbi:MAG: alpha-isopropylmalate synthase regulatory domain-containing protein [Candidatus Buchananbacteria bacterium]
MNSAIESYDATLREGKQAMGVNFGVDALLAIIKLLNQLGVDIIECGWPGANSAWDYLFSAIGSDQVVLENGTRLAAFASTRRAQKTVRSDSLFQKLLAAPVDIMTIFGKSWLAHVDLALKTTPENNLAMIKESVAAIKAAGKMAIFDAEHFFQGVNEDGDSYPFSVLEAAVEGGADRLVLCDTNGIAYSWEVENIVSRVVDRFGSQAAIGVHMHGDRGMENANTLAALRVGARHFQGTVNGYSERVRMTCTLETLANLSLLAESGNAWAQINQVFDSTLIKHVSREVDRLAGQHPNPRKPIVGRASSTHKAGVHVSGGQRAGWKLYESHDPARFGRQRHIVLSGMAGKSGVSAFASSAWNVDLNNCATIEAILAEVEQLEAKGYSFDSCSGSAALLIARYLWPDQVNQFNPIDYHFSTPPAGLPGEIMAHVGVGNHQYVSAFGDGPVDALCRAVLSHVAPQHSCLSDLELDEYMSYQLLVSGKDGTASAMRVEINWKSKRLGSFTTQGVSTNIIDASWGAIKEAISLAMTKQWRSEAVI